MDQVLSQLGEILLKALPTFFLVILLYGYLRSMFFRPLDRVLQARYEATEGSRLRAEETLRRADQKTAEHEGALAAARAEIYREQEAERRRAAEAQAERLREARSRAAEQLRQAREGIAREVEAARLGLQAQSEQLAGEMVRAVLGKGAAA